MTGLSAGCCRTLARYRQLDLFRPGLPSLRLRALSGVAAVLILAISLTQMYPMLTKRPLPPALYAFSTLGPRYGIGNVYHVFPTMQTERQELQIAGSYDGVNWQPYVFRYKPGALDKVPAFIVPHQPRLDWMMWFVPPQRRDMESVVHPFSRCTGGQQTGGQPFARLQSVCRPRAAAFPAGGRVPLPFHDAHATCADRPLVDGRISRRISRRAAATSLSRMESATACRCTVVFERSGQNAHIMVPHTIVV